MGRFVLLRHELEDGSAHFDLMLERDGLTEERRLLTFRVPGPVALHAAHRFEGERIGDHRAVYLEYEGPVPAPGGAGPAGSQGRVKLAERGECELQSESEDALRVVISIRGVERLWVAKRSRAGAGWWVFECDE